MQDGFGEFTRLPGKVLFLKVPNKKRAVSKKGNITM